MTTLTQPIAKLYKRCARKHHDQCPGHFDYTSGQTYSVCSCDCHAGVSDMRTVAVAEVVGYVLTTEEIAEAVAEAQAIVAKPTRKATKKAPVNAGLSTKTDKYAQWANRIVAKNAKLRAAFTEYCEEHNLCVPDSERFVATYVPTEGPRCTLCRIPLLDGYRPHAGCCEDCNLAFNGYVRIRTRKWSTDLTTFSPEAYIDYQIKEGGY